MPKANQKRGRRMKRKHDDLNDPEAATDGGEQQPELKRQRSWDATAEEQHDHMVQREQNGQDDYYQPAEDDFGGREQAFFGMLDEQESEYFKHTEELFELDDFETPEEKLALVQQVYREADGKELKIAHSQGASRLLERLIQMSTAAQLKNLFGKFSGNFLQLMSHRFGSHVAESLFASAASYVSTELLETKGKTGKSDNTQDLTGADPNAVYVSMENLFLHTLAELDGNIAFMMTDRYASHALRSLLLILSGEPVKKETDKQTSRNKGRGVEPFKPTAAETPSDDGTKKRRMPDSFSAALEKLIRDSIAGFDTPKLRALASHPIASPTLQVLLRIEMEHFGRQRAKDTKSIMHTLLPDDPFTAECESAAFLSGLAYDAIGAHLVEAIIRWAPAKLFKKLYSILFKQRLASYARNEIATYIDCRIIERLGPDDLREAHDILAPLIPSLCERRWTALTRTLVERCAARKLNMQPIADQIQIVFRSDATGSFDIYMMLNRHPVTDPSNGDSAASAFKHPVETTKVHFNLLAQAMLLVPGVLSAMILDAMGGCPPAILHQMAFDTVITRTLQQALVTPHATILQRRKLILPFYGQIGVMALDKNASRVVDCIWAGTYGLAFIRERIAEELAENEGQIRESQYGRSVWRNWKMDLYKRRRGEWVRHSRVQASNDGFQSFSEVDDVAAAGTSYKNKDKTPLELARERHARARKERDGNGVITGANGSTRTTRSIKQMSLGDQAEDHMEKAQLELEQERATEDDVQPRDKDRSDDKEAPSSATAAEDKKQKKSKKKKSKSTASKEERNSMVNAAAVAV